MNRCTRPNTCAANAANRTCCAPLNRTPPRSGHHTPREIRSRPQTPDRLTKCKDICQQVKFGHDSNLDKTLSNKDTIIKMLQDQLKKIEDLYKKNMDETEQIRLKYCLAAEELNKFKSLYQRTEAKNEKMFKEKSIVDQTQQEMQFKALKGELLKWRKQCDDMIQKKLLEKSDCCADLKNALPGVELDEKLSKIADLMKDQCSALNHLVQKLAETNNDSKVEASVEEEIESLENCGDENCLESCATICNNQKEKESLKVEEKENDEDDINSRKISQAGKENSIIGGSRKKNSSSDETDNSETSQVKESPGGTPETTSGEGGQAGSVDESSHRTGKDDMSVRTQDDISLAGAVARLQKEVSQLEAELAAIREAAGDGSVSFRKSNSDKDGALEGLQVENTKLKTTINILKQTICENSSAPTPELELEKTSVAMSTQDKVSNVVSEKSAKCHQKAMLEMDVFKKDLAELRDKVDALESRMPELKRLDTELRVLKESNVLKFQDISRVADSSRSENQRFGRDLAELREKVDVLMRNTRGRTTLETGNNSMASNAGVLGSRVPTRFDGVSVDMESNEFMGTELTFDMSKTPRESRVTINRLHQIQKPHCDAGCGGPAADSKPSNLKRSASEEIVSVTEPDEAISVAKLQGQKKTGMTKSKSKRQLQDAYKMLTDHYDDLQKERAEKEKQIKHLETLIAEYDQIDWNADSSDQEKQANREDIRTLELYIDKVIQENAKLKATINGLMDNLTEKIEKLNKAPSGHSSKRASNQSDAVRSKIRANIGCAAFKKHIDKCAGLASSSSDSIQNKPAEKPTFRRRPGQSPRESGATSAGISLISRGTPADAASQTSIATPTNILKPCHHDCHFKERCDMAKANAKLSCLFSLPDANNNGRCRDGDVPSTTSKDTTEQKLKVNSLENYMYYLKKQLEATSTIENEIEGLRMNIMEHHQSYKSLKD